jgi:hypothetical protein
MARTASSKIQKVDIPILETYVEDYRTASRKERRKIITDAHREIKKTSPGMAPLLSASLRKVNYYLLATLNASQLMVNS